MGTTDMTAYRTWGFIVNYGELICILFGNINGGDIFKSIIIILEGTLGYITFAKFSPAEFSLILTIRKIKRESLLLVNRKVPTLQMTKVMHLKILNF